MAKNIKGKTKSEFNYSIPEENLDDYELLEVLGDIEDNPALVTKMVRMLLGKEQADKLKDHVRNENGKVTATAMQKEIEDIFTSVNKAKNS